VPTVTFHGGAVLSNVKVQALFVGSQWHSNPALYSQAQHLTGALSSIVNSSYMDALTNAGYGVGRGSVAPSIIDIYPNKTTQSDFQRQLNLELNREIGNGGLRFPDANTLYVCFAEPSVRCAVSGFHGVFPLKASVVTPGRIVHYVGIAYPGGTAGNPFVPSLGALDSITVTLSREIADAVTDPNLGAYGLEGWYDDAKGGEVGDINPNRIVHINGYALEPVVNKDDFLMTPAQAASTRAVNFVLQTNGTLVEIVRGGASTNLAVGIAAVSDQGIDNQGLAMVDVVTTDGSAFEVHDTGGTGTWVSLGSGVKSAKAGQGVSYVLNASGQVTEYDDATQTYHPIVGSATQIDAGTDAQGVNAVDVVLALRSSPVIVASQATAPLFIVYLPTTAADQYSDDSGAHFIAVNVQSVSAGRQGFSAYVTLGGEGYLTNQSGGFSLDVGSGMAQVTAGTDAGGHWLIDLLLGNGTLEEEGFSTSFYTVGTRVQGIDKAHLGAVDVVLTLPQTIKPAAPRVAGLGGGVVASSTPGAWEHTLSGWRFLTSYAAEAV
jgi:hypothetical protein